MGMRNLIDLINEIAKDNHPPLYYILIGIWGRIFGISEIAIRSFSLVFYISGISLVYYLSKILYKNMNTAFLTSFLYTISAITLKHAINARMYSFLSILVIVSIFLFIKVMIWNEDTRKNISWLVVVNIMGTFTHYWFMFVLLGQGIFAVIFYHRRIKQILVIFILSILPLAALWGPVVLTQATNTSMNFIPIVERAIRYTIYYFFHHETKLFIRIIGAAILVAIVIKLIKKEKPESVAGFYVKELKDFFTNRVNIFLIILVLTLLFVPYYITKFYVPIYLYGRYTIVTFIPFVLIFTGFAARFSNKYVLWIGALALFAVIFAKGDFTKDYEEEYSGRWKAQQVVGQLEDEDMM